MSSFREKMSETQRSSSSRQMSSTLLCCSLKGVSQTSLLFLTFFSPVLHDVCVAAPALLQTLRSAVSLLSFMRGRTNCGYKY